MLRKLAEGTIFVQEMKNKALKYLPKDMIKKTTSRRIYFASKSARWDAQAILTNDKQFEYILEHKDIKKYKSIEWKDVDIIKTRNYIEFKIVWNS